MTRAPFYMHESTWLLHVSNKLWILLNSTTLASCKNTHLSNPLLRKKKKMGLRHSMTVTLSYFMVFFISRDTAIMLK